jgi:hypothetical protein
MLREWHSVGSGQSLTCDLYDRSVHGIDCCRHASRYAMACTVCCVRILHVASGLRLVPALWLCLGWVSQSGRCKRPLFFLFYVLRTVGHRLRCLGNAMVDRQYDIVSAAS